MKAFLNTIIQRFDVGPDAAHIAIIAYSTRPQVVLKFNDPANRNKNAIMRIVNRLPHLRGLTFIDKALFKAESDIFTKEGGIRPNVPQVRLRDFIGKLVA